MLCISRAPPDNKNLAMTNKSLNRSFFSIRIHQPFWGRPSLQILLTSTTSNLKLHPCPLSVSSLLAYVWNTCLLSVFLASEQGKQWCMWCAASLLPPCQCQGTGFFCWQVVCFSDHRTFAFHIKNMFLNFADESSVLGTGSLVIQIFFKPFVMV